MFYLYVLRSLKDHNLYIGISKNIEKRLRQHNSGMTKSTKRRRPFRVIYEEKCESRESARSREKYFKSGIGREFLKKIN